MKFSIFNFSRHFIIFLGLAGSSKNILRYFSGQFSNNKRGFSVAEIIVVLAVVLVLTLVIIIPLSSFRKNQQLNNAVEGTASALSSARSKTLSSENLSQYGVHFESSRLIIFKGAVYSESDPDNIVIDMPSLVEISSISLNGGDPDLVFERLTGKTSDYGTVVFMVKGDAAKTKTIEIKNTGAINVL